MFPESDNNTVYFSDKLKTVLPSVAEELEQLITEVHIPVKWIPGTRDIWARDYMPVQITEGGFIQFRYDPDYLKGFKRLRTARREILPALTGFSVRNSGLIVDGGNIITDGDTVIMTEKVFDENSKLSRSLVTEKLYRLLGVSKIVFLPSELGDPISHSDGMVRFYAPGKVLVNDYSRFLPGFRSAVLGSLDNAEIEYREIPHFNHQVPRGNSLSAIGNYINYLRVSNLIIIPTYNDKRDGQAVQVISNVHPGVKIKTLDCRKVAREGGCWNCLSWCIKEPVFHEVLT